MAIATASDTSDAIHAVTRSTPSITNSKTSGTAATKELHARECATGSRTCWYTAITSGVRLDYPESVRFTPDA